jgi:acyl-coenzyme A synthetase/AMP-(fatty) acid ligase
VHAEFFRKSFASRRGDTALAWREAAVTYGDLLAEWDRARADLEAAGVAPGTVASLEADFSPRAVALLLALVERGGVVIPLTQSVEAKKPEFREVGEVETCLLLGGDDGLRCVPTGVRASHPHYQELRRRGHPGLVLFSSGSTGKSKAAVHDLVPLLAKFEVPRQTLRTLTFLLFDHIGGFNTLFYTLANGGCVVTVADRAPDVVCEAVARHRVELLPTSPTFLNLLLVSEAWKRHDLTSLRLVTYGTEVMPESTLRKVNEVLPHVTLQQTYGLSELGILRSKSRANDSLFVKIGGGEFETRVVEGMLEVKARSAMLGYLNAPSPFTEDGWFRTGDAVEVDGEYVRILGRRSEIINVGGEKVYPAEVESVLQLMDGVVEAAVYGEPSALTGHMVTARVQLSTGESLSEFRRRMRAFCESRLARFQVPQKVVLVEEGLHGERFKKMRRVEA